MKKIKLILPLIAFALFSCDNYLDINDSPNNPNSSQVTPNLSISAVQTSSYSVLVRRMNELGNVFMNNWGANVNSFTGGYAEEFGITMSNNFYEDVWTTVYRSTYEYSRIINYPSANYDNHKAIAKIMKSFYFQYLVDMYGDVPFSEAFQPGVVFQPKLDRQEDLYKIVFATLEDAIVNLGKTSTYANLGSQDLIYGGDNSKWIKAANGLLARYTLRLSFKS